MNQSWEPILRDPVCGMRVNPLGPEIWAEHQGQRYWFCDQSCRERFVADPQAFLQGKKGFFTRWLDRLARVNQKEFGAKGPTCCH